MKNDSYIHISVPLLIRCLEWAHEDAKDDVQIHKFVEKMLLKKDKKMNTDDYESFLGEEVPTTNISDGAVADPANRPLGIGAHKRQPKKNSKTLSLFKRWKDSVDNIT